MRSSLNLIFWSPTASKWTLQGLAKLTAKLFVDPLTSKLAVSTTAPPMIRPMMLLPVGRATSFRRQQVVRNPLRSPTATGIRQQCIWIGKCTFARHNFLQSSPSRLNSSESQMGTRLTWSTLGLSLSPANLMTAQSATRLPAMQMVSTAACSPSIQPRQSGRSPCRRTLPTSTKACKVSR